MVSDILAAIGALGGAAGAAWGGYMKLAGNIAKSRADAAAELARAEAAFRDKLIEREERCREENHELRNEVMTTQARLLVVERSAMLAEVHLEVRGQLDKVLDHLGITPAPVPATVEILTHA